MAELTIPRIAELVREAQIAFCLDKYPSFEVALARKIEATLSATEAEDAERYRWIKSAKGLELHTVAPSIWTREDGSTFIPTHRLAAFDTGYAAYPTLDETIDAARTQSNKET